MTKDKQLWTFIPDVEFPAVLRFDHETGEVIQNKDKREGIYLFDWPDGSTCFPVEMYLNKLTDTKKVKKSDGGTVKAYATGLTHLVRYCFRNKVQFKELRNHHIDELVAELVKERKADGITRSRNNNTIKDQIVPKIVAFLKWLQEEHYPKMHLIGVDDRNARHQIKLKIVKKRGSNGINYGESEVYPLKMPSSTQREKKPISSQVIKLMRDTLNDSKNQMKLNCRLKSVFNGQDQKDHIEYMFQRRRFQLEMLEATGLRPQELVQMECEINKELVGNKKVQIPTLKREEHRFRQVPLERGVAMRLELFILVHRKKLIARLLNYGLISSEIDVEDFIFLNPETGKGVKPDAAAREFERLSKRAGIEIKNCQSMFRHRFITNMVKMHFVSFMEKNPIKNKYNINDTDYGSILKKVSKYTDHKDYKSLYFYIDLAWDELDVFSHAYEISKLHDKLKTVSLGLSDMKSKVKDLGLSEEMLNQILDGLTSIENDADLLSIVQKHSNQSVYI